MIYYLCSDGSVAPRFGFHEPPENAKFIITAEIAWRLTKENQQKVVNFLNLLKKEYPELFIKVGECFAFAGVDEAKRAMYLLVSREIFKRNDILKWSDF